MPSDASCPTWSLPIPTLQSPIKSDASVDESVVVGRTKLLRKEIAQPLSESAPFVVARHRADRTRRRPENLPRVVHPDVAEQQAEDRTVHTTPCLDRVETPLQATHAAPEMFEPAPVADRCRCRRAMRIADDSEHPGRGGMPSPAGNRITRRQGVISSPLTPSPPWCRESAD